MIKATNVGHANFVENNGCHNVFEGLVMRPIDYKEYFGHNIVQGSYNWEEFVCGSFHHIDLNYIYKVHKWVLN